MKKYAFIEDIIALVEEVGPWCCWRLPNKPSPTGYATVCFNGKKRLAARLIRIELIGALTSDLAVDHLCRNRWCVHPNHIEPVTWAVNTARGIGPSALNMKKERCPQGHRYTHRNKNGGRSCRPCLRNAQKKWKAKQRAPLADDARALFDELQARQRER
jgi:hypothetical protein